MPNPNGIPPRPARARQRLAGQASVVVITAAFAVVVGGTGFVSYTHICALTLDLHQSWKTAHIMPLVIDGQIVIGSVFFIVFAGKERFLGLIGIVPGVLESLYANWESGAVYGYRNSFWAAVASQVLAGSTFLFEWWLRKRPRDTSREPRVIEVPVGCGHGLAETRTERIVDLWRHIKDCLGGEPTYRGVAAMLGLHNEDVRLTVLSLAEAGGSGAVQGPAPDPALNGAHP